MLNVVAPLAPLLSRKILSVKIVFRQKDATSFCHLAIPPTSEITIFNVREKELCWVKGREPSHIKC